MSQIGDIMDALLANLIREVGEEEMCLASLLPGDSVLAEYAGLEGCKGMLWVRLVNAGPSATFPAQGIRPDNCFYTLAVPLEAGILRPAPPVTPRMGRSVDLPTNEAQNSAVHQQIEDMLAIRRAIMATARDLDDKVLGSYQPLGPQEGVVGGAWTLTVSVD